MSNINDVVRLSGVSKSTVSRVINNYPHISPEKRNRVLKAIEELGYSPNPSARKLRGQVVTTIGVIVPRIVNPFFSYLVDAIEKAGSQKGYQTLIFQSNEDAKRELDFLNLLKKKQVDGIIMTSYENDWPTIEQYLQYGPIVMCNEYIEEPLLPMVRLDQCQAAYEGINHLIEKGHRRIAYCTGGLFTDYGKDKDRNRGYQKALKEAGIEMDPSCILIKQHTIEDGKAVLKQLLAMEERPTAVFTGSDEVAAGIVIEARKQGVKIPEELAVVGFDDQPLAEMVVPGLTTIRQPVSEMGSKAIDILIKCMNQQYSDEMIHNLPFELIIREST